MIDIFPFVLGSLFGVVISLPIIKLLRSKRSVELFSDPLYYKIFSRKKENLKRIVEYLEKNKKVTNNGVEKFLDVSDSTAKKYLNELEKDGVVIQVGKTVKYVYYSLKK